MDAMKQGVITLLKSAVTAQPLPLPEGFDIEQAMPLVRRHHMATLVYDGAVRCGISRETPAMRKMFQSYCRAMQISEGQMAEFHKICRAFDEAQIDYMPLKGCRMKALYPKPELRLMGDADILIRMEQYEKIRPIMEESGFTEGSESDHELHWISPELHVELHKRLIPSYNRDFHAYFGDGWQLAKVIDGVRYAMAPEDEMVYLFTHFAKHYRDGGIGCRHMVDLWVYRRANPNLDEGYMEAELEKLGLLEFYRNILRLIDFWFCDGPTDEKLEFMSEYVLAAGSWGQMENRVLSLTVRDAKHSALGFSGRLVYIWYILFPGVSVLKSKYTVLKKAPWLLPVVWIIRPFYKVLFEHKSLGQKKKELGMLDRKTLDAHRRMLHYVGLDYNF